MVASVLQENEKRANLLSVYIFITGFAVIVATILLNHFGIFKLKSAQNLFVNTVSALICLVPVVAYCIGSFSQRTLKWLNLTCIVLLVAWIDCFLGYYATILSAAPLILATAYFSQRTTVNTYITSAIAFGFSTYFGAATRGLLDLNHVSVPKGTVIVVGETLKKTLLEAGFRNQQYISHVMTLSYLPKLLGSILMLVLAVFITKFGYEMLIRQAKYTADSTRISTELKFAGDLQANALPPVSAVNGKYNFELAASMTAAKETGGDFYDFTMLDDTHLALVIADVSGKGVPAAMFMMSAKEKLRSALATGRTPEEILSGVNNSLYENNGSKMFVTVWLGIVDITTGRLISANGGHLDPIVYKCGGGFAEIEEQHGMVLGVRRDRTYTNQEYQLESGDALILCTDGVTEARNTDGELYGAERLNNELNERLAGKALSADEINSGLKEQLKDFVGDAEQADDITTLIFKLR